MKRIERINLFLTILGAVLLVACANKASGPQGGPKDETPPVVLKETPLNGALNYKSKEIIVEFDEIIQLENIQDNVLISPPQQKQPEITSYNKKLSVVFLEDLQDSTTYTIQFGNAIVDNNEKNPLKDYTFSFATGNRIDTLEISGTMVNAADLNPVSGILVGIHAELDDSLFTTKPFMRIGKTDENGKFTIKNIREGKYRIFGLNDVSRDYMFQAGEGLAMTDSILIPTVRLEEQCDTIWRDSVTIDSIHTYIGPTYYPNNVLLRYFKENKVRQYFVKNERKEPYCFRLYFGAPADSLPVIKPLGETDWTKQLLLQSNATLDTLTYWITDTLVSQMDTLRFEMTYQKTDSVYELHPQTDTVTVIYRKPRIGSKVKKEEPAIVFMNFKTNIASAFELYNPIVLNMGTPLQSYDTAKIRLLEIVDTIQTPLTLNFEPLDSIGMVFHIPYKWEPEHQYELQIDSTAFVDIYGNHNDTYTGKFKIRSLDEYSKLVVKLENYNPKAVIQMLDTKDAVVRTLPASPEGAVFEYLKPTDYYLRLFIDENGDGKWTTGDFSRKLQPEEVYYYPSKLTLRANWDFEENWNYLDRPLLEQKPADIRQDASKKK